MDKLLLINFSWGKFLLIALVLIAIYTGLFVIQQFTKHSSFSGRFQKEFKNLFRQIYIVYELVAILILASVFVLINPFLNGMILLFLVLGSLPYIRSYISGRWVHFDQTITEGVEIKTGGLQGVILKMGRVKMRMQTKEGLHHLSYNKLLTNGYTLISGNEIGGFYHLELLPKDSVNDIKNHHLHLMDLFATAPYIDWHHKPEIFQNDSGVDTVDAKVLIKEESHLQELIGLIKEWGYNCTVTG